MTSLVLILFGKVWQIILGVLGSILGNLMIWFAPRYFILFNKEEMVFYKTYAAEIGAFGALFSAAGLFLALFLLLRKKNKGNQEPQAAS